MAKPGSRKRTKRNKATKKPIESYDHRNKKRANNPPVGLVTPETAPDAGRRKTYDYDPHLDPQLVWAGKAERLRGTVRLAATGPKDGWARLAKRLKAEVDEELIEAYRGTMSLPITQGNHKRVGVKIIDERGIERLKIVEVGA